MLGTNWTAKGEGATKNEIMRELDRFQTPGLLCRDSADLLRQARENIARLPDGRTNLSLTGAPLRDYDMARLASASLIVATA